LLSVTGQAAQADSQRIITICNFEMCWWDFKKY